jgi:hypothetical protein
MRRIMFWRHSLITITFGAIVNLYPKRIGFRNFLVVRLQMQRM